MHLATHVPPMAKMTNERSWTTHNWLRTTATRNLLAEAERAGVAVFVKESITLGYGDHGERWIAEDTPLEESNPVIVAAAEGERLTNGFTGADRRGVVLRFGLFYGPTARSTDEALRLARVRLSMLPGPADAYVTSTHVDDVASAVVAALTVPAGVYNVGDDIPLTRRDYVMAFADAFALSPLRLLPAGLLRRLAPRAAAVLTASQRCSNAKFREAARWQPTYADARQGWNDTAQRRARRPKPT